MNFKLYDALHSFRHNITVNELRLMHQDYSQTDITYNTILYFDLIHAHQGQYTATAIAELLHVSKPAVIMKVNELIKKGLIYKEQSKKDKRVYYLFANEDISPLFQQYHQNHSRMIEKLEKIYKEEDIEKFCEILDLIGEQYLKEI